MIALKDHVTPELSFKNGTWFVLLSNFHRSYVIKGNVNIGQRGAEEVLTSFVFDDVFSSFQCILFSFFHAFSTRFNAYYTRF